MFFESSTCYLHIKDHITIVTRKKKPSLFFALRKYTAEDDRKKENLNFISNVIQICFCGRKGHDFIIVRDLHISFNSYSNFKD